MMEGKRTTDQLDRVLCERDAQPEWRAEADRCHQYYDGRQLEPTVAAALRARGLPELVTNLIQPAVNGVLGMEARTRTDWFVQADDDEFREIAEGLNVRLNEALRVAAANRACSEAYKGQVITGIGWVEVKPNRDPLGAAYRITSIHRDEVFWDMRSSYDLSNCRWMMRSRWVDVDEVEAVFPSHKDAIRASIGRWTDFDFDRLDWSPVLTKAYDEFQYSTRNESEWINDHRDMVRVYELYYRVWQAGVILRDPGGRAVEFNEHNPLHVALINSGRVAIERRVIPRLRVCWHVGPHKIKDMPSPHPHNYYPYIPFFGAQEDKTNIPYGLVRGMLSPQDEINFRRIRLTSELNYKRIIMDDDATSMSDNDLLDAVHRPDGIVRLNSKSVRKENTIFRVETDLGISAQQFSVMQDAKMLIQDVAGIYNAFLGKDSGAQSGIAINSLVEQGATTLADIADNYRWSRRMVGELVMAHEINKLKQQRNVSVVIPAKHGQKAREVVLNQEQEAGEVSNAVAVAKTQVVLGEINQSAGYRAQVTQMVLDFVKGLPGEVQMHAMSIVLEQLDLPEDKKAQLMKVIQKATGEVDPDEMTPEQQQQLQAEQQKRQMLDDLAMQELKQKVAKLEAEAALTVQRAGTEQMKQAEMAMELKSSSRVPPPLPEPVM